MALSESQRVALAKSLRRAADEDIRAPLWEYSPALRPLVMHERRVRFPGVFETDEIDPEYA